MILVLLLALAQLVELFFVVLIRQDQFIGFENESVLFSMSIFLMVRYWLERSALQSVADRRSTGNDDSGPLFSSLIFFSPFFSAFFLRRDLFS